MKNQNKRIDKLKLMIKSSIEEAAKEYTKVAGKTFLFVYGDKFIELAFLTDRFAHLTGIKLYTSAHSFYENAKNGTLSIEEYGFDERHKFDNAKKKPLELLKITSWLTSESIILEDIQISERINYNVGLTNSQSSILFVENTDKNKNKINNWYVPCSLRVKDSCLKKAKGSKKITFIFVKEAKQIEYVSLLAKDADSYVPVLIEQLISKELFDKYRKKDNFDGDGGERKKYHPFDLISWVVLYV